MGVHYAAARLKVTGMFLFLVLSLGISAIPMSSFHPGFLYSPLSHFSFILLYLWIYGNTAIVHR